MSDLVLHTFGFQSVEQWQDDPHFGSMSEVGLMKLLGYKTLEEWRAVVNKQKADLQKHMITVLSAMWRAIGKQPDQTQLEYYYREFQGYPPERIEAAIAELIRTRKWSNVPSIAEIYGNLN
mgnify:CR=1 FL=1